MMTRKDSEKDAERPHYYSQFWLDVAAGRRVIGAPRPGEESEATEPEAPEPARRPARGTAAAISDGHVDTYPEEVEPVVEPEEAEEFIEPETEVEEEPEEADFVDEVDDQELPNILVEEPEVPDLDVLASEEEELEDEDLYDEEEDEEDGVWPSGRGRKKPKPGRPVKPPKKPKREPRRGY